MPKTRTKFLIFLSIAHIIVQTIILPTKSEDRIIGYNKSEGMRRYYENWKFFKK